MDELICDNRLPPPIEDLYDRALAQTRHDLKNLKVLLADPELKGRVDEIYRGLEVWKLLHPRYQTSNSSFTSEFSLQSVLINEGFVLKTPWHEPPKPCSSNVVIVVQGIKRTLTKLNPSAVHLTPDSCRLIWAGLEEKPVSFWEFPAPELVLGMQNCHQQGIGMKFFWRKGEVENEMTWGK